MKNSWSNVQGELAIELYSSVRRGYNVDTIFNAHDDKAVPAITLDMVPNIQEDVYELVIEFLSSGYYDEGKKLGSPDDCYPPEEGEERVPSRAYLIHYLNSSGNTAEASGDLQKEEIELSHEKMRELFAHFLA